MGVDLVDESIATVSSKLGFVIYTAPRRSQTCPPATKKCKLVVYTKPLYKCTHVLATNHTEVKVIVFSVVYQVPGVG